MQFEQSNIYKGILQYCIASEHYKSLNSELFIKYIEVCDIEKLIQILYKAHILGLFYYEVNKLNNCNRFNEYLKPFIDYQEIINNHLVYQLRGIENIIKQNHVKILILKGPSFWGTLYDKYYIRKVDDLDLMLFKEEDILTFCNKLLDLGYCSNEKEFEKRIYDNRYFGLDHFTKSEKLILNELEINLINRYYYLLKKLNLKITPTSRIEFKLNECFLNSQIEIHKSIYVFKNGNFPLIQEKYYNNHPIFSEFNAFCNAFNLVYLSTKFLYDCKKYPKCLKLIADFVKTLELCNQEDIIRSIQIAEEIKSLDTYFVLLNSIRELTPEVEFKSLDDFHFDPLDRLLNEMTDTIRLKK